MNARADADRTDEELVAAVRRGDDRAFETLWQRYHRRIAAYVNGMVNDHGRAEDITQDVFMSALRRMRETDRPIAFKPWLYEIAKNACIDAFRRSRRAEEISYDAEAGLPSADQVRLVSSSPTPDVAVDHRMSLDNLRGAFGGLSETHHDILVMRELEGLSYREIGERLGMSRPSVESTLFRARRRLTEEYEELVSGERCRRVQGMILAASGTALGARDARRMSRHVSHCQGCRREAAIAGLDMGAFEPRPLRQRVAALLPVPAFLRKRFGGGDEAAAVVAGHGPATHWAASLIGQYAEPAALSGWAKAAAAAATIAVAGVGTGAATDRERMGFGGRDEGVPEIGRAGGDDAGGGRSGDAGGGPAATASAGARGGGHATRPRSDGSAGSGGEGSASSGSSSATAPAGRLGGHGPTGASSPAADATRALPGIELSGDASSAGAPSGGSSSDGSAPRPQGGVALLPSGGGDTDAPSAPQQPSEDGATLPAVTASQPASSPTVPAPGAATSEATTDVLSGTADATARVAGSDAGEAGGHEQAVSGAVTSVGGE